MVGGFVGTFPQQVRIVGESAGPQAILYRANMTVLDVIIATGGLTEFADGNNTTLVRLDNGDPQEYRVRLDDLLEDGDISANVALLPGDILIVPETFFRSEEHTSELQSLMRISYAVFCLKKITKDA